MYTVTLAKKSLRNPKNRENVVKMEGRTYIVY